MKYQIGDKVTVLATNEEGIITDIVNEEMVMIEVKAVRFPVYVDQIDFPYFKMFTQKKSLQKKKLFIDDMQREKITSKEKTGEGVFLSFLPIFNKDILEDNIVTKFKLHLINHNKIAYSFSYDLLMAGKNTFHLDNTLEPQSDFYLHDVNFEDLSNNPRFHFEFSLKISDKTKVSYYEASLKLKAKQLFKKLEEMQLKNEPTFTYILFNTYPNKEEDIKVELTKPHNDTFKVYDATKIRQNLEPAKSVVDLHIDKLIDDWSHLSNYEILSLQLQTFEKYYHLAVAHQQPSLIIIHGVGMGRLRDEIHNSLRLQKEVKSFVNQYHHLYGYGATEIYFQYE